MKAIRPLRKLLDRAHRRFIRSRPGSVLILVVALLVLMALIGTAFMTMAQFDRAASVQHAFNTEVDLLVDGVINQVKATVTGDLFVNGNFRPSLKPQYDTNSGYYYFNGVGLDLGTASLNAGGTGVANPGDPWLAARTPDLLNNLTSDNSGGAVPAWPFVSAPLSGSGSFDSPYWPGGGGSAVHFTRPNNAIAPALTPGWITISGTAYPSFTRADSSGKPFNVLAADADGDGQADSGMYKLLSLDGITYYAAVRIVDNCAAINASIACMPNPISTYSKPSSVVAGMPGDFSPVNLDLFNMLTATAEFLPYINSYRFNSPNPGNSNGGQALSDVTGLPRNDFAWIPYPVAGLQSMYFDQQWAQLGRRLQNPGNVVTGSPTNAAKLFQALPITESMVMARNFVLKNPSTPNAAASSSVLERLLPQTTFNSADSAPYPLNPVGLGLWYNDNFNYNTTNVSNATALPKPMPMRALLVARNPVSNFCPNKFNFAPLGGAYQFGDVRNYLGHRYVCICQGATANPLPPDQYWSDMYWAYEPWTTAPTKTSVNTATFQQLYAAYWATMCTTPNVPPVPNVAGGSQMFRCPVRSETVATPSPLLTALQVLYLRAAIAAVNTMDLRDRDDDVTSRTIQISSNLYATVYGIEKQPYVTHVYAQNNEDPTKDWGAIELINPYPNPITMTNWQLVAATRNSGSVTLTNIAPIPSTVIPANSYVVLVDQNPIPTGVTLTGATTQVPIPQLCQKGFGKEILIMRPRLASGTLTKSAVLNNTYDETTSATNANDLVPVDCYDFTNMPATAASGASEEWEYVRPTRGKNWHFVYPGPWNATTAGGGGGGAGPKPPTLSATQATTPPQTPRPLAFGATHAQFMQTKYFDVPLQLNNTDFGGPSKSTSGTPNPNVFPYGTFAHNGDILQVPFIGSYKIWSGTSDISQTIIELNPVTMDSITATANDQSTMAVIGQPIANATMVAENIGRFAPIDKNDATNATAPKPIDDFAPALAGGVANPLWRYHWAMQLFDFLTVQSPQDDYSPNVDPWSADPNYGYAYRYPPANASTSLLPIPTANVNPQVANAGLANPPGGGFLDGTNTEETAPVDGLVNVNTAPWRVLAAVPWIPASDATYATKNVKIAQAIVRYRDVDDQSGSPTKHGHGPFLSLFELNEVLLTPAAGGGKLRDILGSSSSTDFTPAQGNLSPIQITPPGGPDGIGNDFESRYNLITRVSNLVTTRSDSYTAYILVQGWRNAETNNPTLVVQRRAAIILDRSGVTPSNTSPTVVNVPE